MSTEKVTPGKAYARLAARDFHTAAARRKRPVAENIDISALSIDESYDADCDPYNNTGQHLGAALKKKYEE